MQAFVQANRRNGVRTTLKTLVEKFERKPYGWQLSAVLCILAKLCARGKIEIRSNSDMLEDKDLEKALRNTHGYANLVLDPQVDFPASQVRRLKTFYEDFFDAPPKGNEAKELGKETADAFSRLIQDLDTLCRDSGHYPFLSQLESSLSQIKKQVGKPYAYYLAEIGSFEDACLISRNQPLIPFAGS